MSPRASNSEKAKGERDETYHNDDGIGTHGSGHPSYRTDRSCGVLWRGRVRLVWQRLLRRRNFEPWPSSGGKLLSSGSGRVGSSPAGRAEFPAPLVGFAALLPGRDWFSFPHRIPSERPCAGPAATDRIRATRGSGSGIFPAGRIIRGLDSPRLVRVFVSPTEWWDPHWIQDNVDLRYQEASLPRPTGAR